MNAIALNNLWTYLAGLGLTASNKEWLAEHLFDVAKEERVAAKAKKKLIITKEDLVLSAEILEPVKDLAPLPADYDFDKERANYLMKKYG